MLSKNNINNYQMNLQTLHIIPKNKLDTYNSNYKLFTKEVVHFVLSEESNEFNMINSILFEISNDIIKILKLKLKELKTYSNKYYDMKEIFIIVFSMLEEEYVIFKSIIDNDSNSIIYNIHKVKNLVMTMYIQKGQGLMTLQYLLKT